MIQWLGLHRKATKREGFAMVTEDFREKRHTKTFNKTTDQRQEERNDSRHTRKVLKYKLLIHNCRQVNIA